MEKLVSGEEDHIIASALMERIMHPPGHLTTSLRQHLELALREIIFHSELCFSLLYYIFLNHRSSLCLLTTQTDKM